MLVESYCTRFNYNRRKWWITPNEQWCLFIGAPMLFMHNVLIIKTHRVWVAYHQENWWRWDDSKEACTLTEWVWNIGCKGKHGLLKNGYYVKLDNHGAQGFLNHLLLLRIDIDKMPSLGNVLVMATIPVAKILIMCGIGAALALPYFDVFTVDARKHMNKVTLATIQITSSPPSSHVNMTSICFTCIEPISLGKNRNIFASLCMMYEKFVNLKYVTEVYESYITPYHLTIWWMDVFSTQGNMNVNIYVYMNIALSLDCQLFFVLSLQCDVEGQGSRV